MNRTYTHPIDEHFNESEFLDFVAKHDHHFGGSLSGRMNASRVISLFWWKTYVDLFELTKSKIDVAVVSGSLREPELAFLEARTVEVISFENDKRFDLSIAWDRTLIGKHAKSYDIVMCNQVLEHLYDPITALENLFKLVKHEGLLFITVPVVNCIHGEPYFYSSGYHPRFFLKFVENTNLGIGVLRQGVWGNREYTLNAVSGRWLSVNELIGLSKFSPFVSQRQFWSDTWILYKLQR